MEKLKKELGMSDVFAIVTGAMISSGLFILPGLAYERSGPAVILAYLVAGLLNVPTMFSAAELATALPRAGGTYFYIDRSMGPLMGTVGGISLWLSVIFKSSFALIGIGAFAQIVFPGLTPLHMKIIAAVLALCFMYLNFRGAKEAGKLQIAMVAGMLLILAVYIVEGFIHLEPSNFKPFIPFGHLSVISTAAMVYISFAGLTLVADVSEEVKDPGRNIPNGMFLAFITVISIYVMSVLVTVGVIPGKDLAGNMLPLVDGAGVSLANFGRIVIAIAAVLSFATTANAGIMAASRTPVSMSRDGHLPTFFQEVHPKFQTPVKAIIMTVSLMVFFILFFEIETFVKIASTIMIVLFVLMNLSVIIMRESRLYNYRPLYKSPLYPWVQIVGVVANVGLIFVEGITPVLTAGILLLAGVAWYLIYSRIKVNRESALVHVMERYLSGSFTRDESKDSLGVELKKIVHERDEVIEDQFDHLLRESPILDVEESMEAEKFFEHIADYVSEKWDEEKETLFSELKRREDDATSILFTGVAVKVLFRENSRKLKLIIVRSREGQKLSSTCPPVNALFVFRLSNSTRTFFMRALIAISQIFMTSGFEMKWKEARDEDRLREALLAGERQRIHVLPVPENS